MDAMEMRKEAGDDGSKGLDQNTKKKPVQNAKVGVCCREET